jgi:hypothetical protein
MRAIVVATVASAALVALYLALGGASYAPAAVADPCTPRDWRDPSGLPEVGEQIMLSALDGAACELGVSREEMVLAFASGTSLERFAAEHGVSAGRLEQLVRAGLLRAIDDAAQADAIEPTIANALREVVRRVPVRAILNLLEQLPQLSAGRTG